MKTLKINFIAFTATFEGSSSCQHNTKVTIYFTLYKLNYPNMSHLQVSLG